MPVAIDPKDIVEKVRIKSLDLSSTLAEEKEEERPQDMTDAGSTQVGLAFHALKDSRVNLVGDGLFVVKEVDGLTRRIATLFPKETCSCPSVTTCYHIIACQEIIGHPLTENGKCNVTELRRKDRKSKERPSGGKRPRKDDFKDSNKRICKIWFCILNDTHINV